MLPEEASGASVSINKPRFLLISLNSEYYLFIFFYNVVNVRNILMIQSCIGRLEEYIKQKRVLYAGVMAFAHRAENTGAGKFLSVSQFTFYGIYYHINCFYQYL